MKKAEYPIFVHQLCDEDGGGFTAVAPDLVGCRGDGASVDEAVADLYLAMDEWFDEIKRLGREVPTPYTFNEQADNQRKTLDELIAAQKALIKAQDEAIRDQDASLSDLRHQVVVLTTALKRSSGVAASSSRKGKPWFIGEAPKRMPIVKRVALPH